MKLNAISLFSGALGLDLGVEQAGFDVRLCVEKNNLACETIRFNRPDLTVFEGDVAKLSGEQLLTISGIEKGSLTLLTGGAPCQSFSTAGRRRSFNDPRGNLVLEFARLVSETEPDYFILENVRGILSAAIKHRPLNERGADHPPLEPDEEQGSVLSYIYEMFDEIGYTVHHKLLMAADFGVPQKRQRVFFIGSKDGCEVPFPEPTHSEVPGLFTKRWVTLGNVLDDLVQETVEAPSYSEKRAKYLRMVPAGGNWRDLPEEMQPEAMGGAYNSTGGRVGFFRRLSWDEPSPTLLTSPNQKSTMMCHPDEDRPLSVAEYARIQQFPDDWVFCGNMAAKYRQIGNAVPVGLGKAVAGAISEHIRSKTN